MGLRALQAGYAGRAEKNGSREQPRGGAKESAGSLWVGEQRPACARGQKARGE